MKTATVLFLALLLATPAMAQHATTTTPGSPGVGQAGSPFVTLPTLTPETLLGTAPLLGAAATPTGTLTSTSPLPPPAAPGNGLATSSGSPGAGGSASAGSASTNAGSGSNNGNSSAAASSAGHSSQQILCLANAAGPAAEPFLTGSDLVCAP